ncbi:hypothetical protein QBC41DRAFT_299781 [Cercophora samala]|uniref:Uncharacterized protein n=1 Tax=Cercophora samala TaxID=330535 RepID=A0AA39ZK44_9PEZI|nr:hypothetical protein QBC41DRAFT_299781 [Cercophora samala]
MLSLITLAASALALFGVAHGSISDFTWTLPVNLTDPNSATVSITGTIERAVAKMEADYPGWNATFMARGPPPPSDGNNRDDQEPPQVGTFNCRPKGEDFASRGAIRAGIQYLRKVPGTAKNGAGPDNCGRVSCSWNSAIIWCNQDDVEKEVEWNQIADGARDISYKCLFDVHVNVVRGHVDYDDKWGVIVRKDTC